ncbi:MAG: hypothetical protein WKF35_02725 [Ferruginibacter sp.]
MLRSLIISILPLLGLSSSTLGQSKEKFTTIDSGIFLGKISGVTAKEFNEEIRYDSLFGFNNLTDSKYLIEIRFFEISNLALNFCTTLYYDSEFKLTRRNNNVRQYDTSKFRVIEYQPLANMNADSIFSKLVQNSIFSYQPSNYWDDKPKVLTSKGIVNDTKLCGQTDGSWYQIDIKVGNNYKRIITRSDRQFLSKCYPDNSDFKKEASFISLLETRPLIKTK